MLAYALHEKQWVDTIINYQHIIDESFIYVLCVLLLLFSGYVDAETRVLLGYIMIGIIFMFVVFNTIVIIYYTLQRIWLFLKRIFVQCQRKKLRKEVITIVEKINEDLANHEKDWFVPDELGWFEADDTGYGGYKLTYITVTCIDSEPREV